MTFPPTPIVAVALTMWRAITEQVGALGLIIYGKLWIVACIHLFACTRACSHFNSQLQFFDIQFAYHL
jgi:hypothetical protein